MKNFSAVKSASNWQFVFVNSRLNEFPPTSKARGPIFSTVSLGMSTIPKRKYCGGVPSRVSTEFRRHGIPSVFFTSVYSVFRAELAKIPPEFRWIPCLSIPWNSAEVHGILWLFSYTEFRISLPVLDRYLLLYFLVQHCAIPGTIPCTYSYKIDCTVSKFFFLICIFGTATKKRSITQRLCHLM